MTKYQYYKYLSSKTRIVIELGWGEGTGTGCLVNKSKLSKQLTRIEKEKIYNIRNGKVFIFIVTENILKWKKALYNFIPTNLKTYM